MLSEALGCGPPERSIVVCVWPLPFSPMPEGCSRWDWEWLDGKSGMIVPECGSTLPVGAFLSKSLDFPDVVVIGECDVPPSSAFEVPLTAKMAAPATRPENTKQEHRVMCVASFSLKSDGRSPHETLFGTQDVQMASLKFPAIIWKAAKCDHDTLSFVNRIMLSP
jgi:hypothetical protein